MAGMVWKGRPNPRGAEEEPNWGWPWSRERLTAKLKKAEEEQRGSIGDDFDIIASELTVKPTKVENGAARGRGAINQ